jgi:hypothetical protein
MLFLTFARCAAPVNDERLCWKKTTVDLADDGVPLLCPIDIGIVGSRLVDHRDYHRGDRRSAHGLRCCKNKKLWSMLGGSFGMESPQTAARLMTPTAVLIAVGAFAPSPPDWWILFACR